MSRRKREQEDSFETAEGFQIEDMEGNPVEDTLEEDEEGLSTSRNSFWDDDEDEDEDAEEDDYFNSIAEQNDWEEGYDY